MRRIPCIGRIIHIAIYGDVRRMSWIKRSMWIAMPSSYMKNHGDEYLNLVITNSWCMYTSTCLHARIDMYYIWRYTLYFVLKDLCSACPIFIVGFVYLLMSCGSHPSIPFFQVMFSAGTPFGVPKSWKGGIQLMLSLLVI